MPQQKVCLYSAATKEVKEGAFKCDKGEWQRGKCTATKNGHKCDDPKCTDGGKVVEWTHDGKCETLPYFKERTAEADYTGQTSHPKWKLTTYKKESDQCKKICDTGTKKHCCIATCDPLQGNTCKLTGRAGLAPEWYLSSAALEDKADESNYERSKGWIGKWPGRPAGPTHSRKPNAQSSTPLPPSPI